MNVCREVFHIPYGGGKNDMVGVAATETHSAVGVRVEGTQSTQDCANYTWQGQTACFHTFGAHCLFWVTVTKREKWSLHDLRALYVIPYTDITG